MTLDVRQVDIFRNRVRGGHSEVIEDSRNSGGELREYYALTCCHCGRAVVLENGFIRHGQIMRNKETGEIVSVRWYQSVNAPGFCRKCNARTCDNFICNHECKPVLKTIEERGALGATGDGRHWAT